MLLKFFIILKVEEHQNDCEELLRTLSNISSDCNDSYIVDIFQHIHGPWAFVYFQVVNPYAYLLH